MDYENLFSSLTDEEIHNIARNTDDSDKLESAINNWFLDSTKYNEPEMVHNIEIETEKCNPFSMFTLAIWYREGNHVSQSDAAYIHMLEKILSVKTEKLNSETTLIALQTNKTVSHKLYDEILGEASLQLGQYYSDSSNKNEIEKAKKFFELSKWYAPKTVATTLPLIIAGPAAAVGIIGLGAGLAGGGVGIVGGLAGAAMVPIVGQLVAAGGLAGLGVKYVKNKIHKKRNTQKNQETSEKLSAEQIVINDFGELWYKLSNNSRESLSAAYKTYYTFANDKNYDFSSVIALLGKALEGELKYRFYDEYIEYLVKRFGIPSNYKDYNRLSNEQFESRFCLLYKSKQNCQFCDYVNHPNFSIGSFRYVIGIDKAGNCSSTKKTFCDQSLIDYTKEILYKDIFHNKTNEKIDDLLKELSDNIEILRGYRNKADHPGAPLTLEDANKVLQIMIYTRKILLRILNPLVPFAE